MMKRKLSLLVGLLLIGGLTSCQQSNGIEKSKVTTPVVADAPLASENTPPSATPTSTTSTNENVSQETNASFKWIYYMQNDDNTLMQLNLETGEKKEILKNVLDFYVSKDQLFYDTPIDLENTNEEEPSFFMSSFYVANLDGSNAQLIAGKDKPVMPIEKLEANEYISYSPLKVEDNWLYFRTYHASVDFGGEVYMYRYDLNDGIIEPLSDSYMSFDQCYIGHDKIIFSNKSLHYSLGDMVIIDLTTKEEKVLCKDSSFLGTYNDKLYYFASESKSSEYSYEMGLYELDPINGKTTLLTNGIPWEGYGSQSLLNESIAYCITLSEDSDTAMVHTFNLATKEESEVAMNKEKVQQEIINITPVHSGENTYELISVDNIPYVKDVYQLQEDGSKSQLISNVRYTMQWVADTK